MATNFLLTSLFSLLRYFFLQVVFSSFFCLSHLPPLTSLSHTTNFSISCCSFNFHVKQSLSSASHCHVNDTFQTECISSPPTLAASASLLAPGSGLTGCASAQGRPHTPQPALALLSVASASPQTARTWQKTFSPVSPGLPVFNPAVAARDLSHAMKLS